MKLHYYAHLTLLLVYSSSISWNRTWFTDSDMRVCGDITGPYFDYNPVSGHSAHCFRHKPMSFEACRLLLEDTEQCSALSYDLNVCSLHDRSHPDFVISYGVSSTILFIKITSIDDCREGIVSVSGAKARFQQCLATENSRDNPLRTTKTKALPKLGIVMSVTSAWAASHKSGLLATVSNFQCYADVHNYTFILHELPSMSSARFFTVRHEALLKTYLPRFQHILHVDADSLVLNLSRSLDDFLSSPFDVHLHMHENGEVTASTYLLRNSWFSRCFMRYWLQWAPPHAPVTELRHAELTYTTLNFDNGDLVAALMELVDSDFARRCSRIASPPAESKNQYLDTVVRCFRTLSANMTRRMSSVAPLIRIYLPREGYWRTHARRGRFLGGDWWDDLFGSCFPSSDVIGHGWKAMARHFWTTNGTAHTCDLAAARVGRGANRRCVWLSERREREILRHFCAWRSPHCTTLTFGAAAAAALLISDDNDYNHWTAGNKCLYSREGAETGVGLRLKGMSDSSTFGCGYPIGGNRVGNQGGLDAKLSASGVESGSGSGSEEWFDIASEAWIRQQMCASCPHV